MKKIDSDALGDITRALGLSGRGAPITELTDGIVDQSLNVNELVRRGRTIAGTQGIFTAVMRNVHGAGNTLATTVSPYETPAGNTIAPWPSPMPKQFDIWLLSATVRQASGTGTLAAALYIDYAGTQQGWGETDSGGGIVSAERIPLAFWDALATVSNEFAVLNQLGTFARIGMRIPRPMVLGDTNLVFISVSSAIATFDCQLVLGVFPIGFGQDGLL